MTDLVKIKALTAAELLEHFEISEEAEPCLIPDTNPQVNIEKLMEGKHFHDAVTMLAHGLPKREAVWWACLAARQSVTPETDDDNMSALVYAEAWVKKPTEENRLKCREFGTKTKHRTGPSWAAMAACWSTGNLAEGTDVEVSTPEYLYAHAVAGSVSLSASLGNPEKVEEKYTLYLKQGFDLARGGNGRIEQ